MDLTHTSCVCARDPRVHKNEKQKAIVKSNTNAEGEIVRGTAHAYASSSPARRLHISALGTAHYSEPRIEKVKFMTFDTCFFPTAV